jgi:rhodanese-related sulfurtransferase
MENLELQSSAGKARLSKFRVALKFVSTRDEELIMSGLLSRAARKKIFKEVVFVAAGGIVFGLLANYLSPKGLGLAHNYFPSRASGFKVSAAELKSSRNASPDSFGSGTNAGANPESISPAALRLKENGLQMLEVAQIWQLFHDSRYQQHVIVFIDARDDHHYEEGHIPGAYQFDHYHPEKYLADIYPVCQSAEQVIVYCNGGDCEDSVNAALMLKDVGIATRKLFVFSGGITEWTAKKFPLETGPRPDGGPQPGSGK